MSYGIHINNIKKINKIRKYGGTWVQIMYPNIFKINSMNVVLHLSYTINIAEKWNIFSPWIIQFIDEIFKAEKINAKFVVIHLGKQKDKLKEECYNNMLTTLYFVHQQTKKINIKILLETSAGVGSDLCYKIEDLIYFFNKIKNHPDKLFSDRFGICIDTCHIFVAGYDISNYEIFCSYMEMFNNLVGLNYIKLVHLNDSLNEVGSRIDKHENLGDGYIGKGLIPIIKYFTKLNIPMLTETRKIKNLLFIKKAL